MNFIIAFIISLILFIILDFTWISFNFNYYMTLLKKIQKEPFLLKIPPIIISYICLGIALYLYLKLLSFEYKTQNNINKYLIALLYGCLFGIAVYGTYSFTCCTYYKNYSYYDGFIDTTWGIFLFSIIGIIFTYLF
jgi:uncharacterized membrane protein